MAGKITWFFYAVDHVLRTKSKLYKQKKSYCRRNFVENEEASVLLSEAILSGAPFMAGRYGLFEVAAMRMYEFKKKKKYSLVMDNIYNCAGFFPNDVNLGFRFLERMIEATKKADLLSASSLWVWIQSMRCPGCCSRLWAVRSLHCTDWTKM